MFKFTEDQVKKIHHSLFATEGVEELFDYILAQGYYSSSSQGTDYAYFETFRHADKKLTVVFTKLFPTVRADHGHFSVSVMDHVEQNDKYYGHIGTEVLEQIKGKI